MHLDIAWQLCERLPAVWEALHAGDIDLPRARVICDQTAHLDVEEARRVADAVLVEAGERTTGQLKARLRRLVIETNPEAEAERYRQGVEARRVVLDANSDGTANLAAWDLPADGAQAAMVHVNRLARAVKTADDPRTMDQVRADVLLDLLQGIEHDDAERSMGRAAVDIRVDLTTLLGLSESAAEIPGWGPVIAEVARRVVDEQHDALWSFAVTGDDDQNLVWSGVTRRRPTAAQSRHVQARDRTCVFPGCHMPARRVRSRPQGFARRGRPHPHRKPGPPLPPRPPPQTRRWLETHPSRGRHLQLDQPIGPKVRNPPPRTLKTGSRLKDSRLDDLKGGVLCDVRKVAVAVKHRQVQPNCRRCDQGVGLRTDRDSAPLELSVDRGRVEPVELRR